MTLSNISEFDGYDCTWFTLLEDGWKYHSCCGNMWIEIRENRVYEKVLKCCSGYKVFVANALDSYLKIKNKYYRMEKIIHIDNDVCVVKYLEVDPQTIKDPRLSGFVKSR